MAIILRPFVARDAPHVRRIVLGILSDYGLQTDPTTDADLVDIGQSYARGRFYVWDDGERIVGCGGLTAPIDGRAEIRKMYLLAEARGQRLGRRLLQQLLDDARALGATTVWLETNAVLREALAMYKRAGFVECVGVAPSCARCTLTMEKLLDAQ